LCACDSKEATELAKQKRLSILSGLQSRYQPSFRELIRRIHDGAIGEIVAFEEHFERGPYNVVARNPKLNEVEFQFSAQMHFTWLSGDDVNQSLAHNLDRVTWAMKEQTPVKVHGMGGRIEGETNWKYPGPGGNPYDLEYKAFFEAIRSGNPLNCGDYMARSSQVAVMGQLSCYCGKELTWDQVSKSNFFYAPKAEDVRLDMEPPVKPDEKGNYPVPLPGITEFKI